MNEDASLELSSPPGAGRIRTCVLGDGWTLLLDSKKTYCTRDGESWRPFELPAGTAGKSYACPAGAVGATPEALWFWPVGGEGWIRTDRWRKERDGRSFDEFSPMPVAVGDLVFDYENVRRAGACTDSLVDVYLLKATGLELAVHEMSIPGRTILSGGLGPDGDLVIAAESGFHRVEAPETLRGVRRPGPFPFEFEGQLRRADLSLMKAARTGLGPVSSGWAGPWEAFEARDRAEARRVLGGLHQARRLGRPGRYLEVFGPVRTGGGVDAIATSAGIVRVLAPAPDPGLKGGGAPTSWVPAPSPGELAWRLWAFGDGATDEAFDALLDGRGSEVLGEAASRFIEDPLAKLLDFARGKRRGRVAQSCSKGLRLLLKRTSTDGIAFAREHATDPVVAVRAVAFAAVPTRGVDMLLEERSWGVRRTEDPDRSRSREECELARAAVAGLEDPDPSVRALAAGACGRLEDPECTGSLARLLLDVDDLVSEEALEALEAFSSPMPCDFATFAWEQLRFRGAGDASPVRLVSLLGQVDGPVGDDTLVALLGDPRWKVRLIAETTLGRRANRLSRGAALRLFDASTVALASLLLTAEGASRRQRGKVVIEVLQWFEAGRTEIPLAFRVAGIAPRESARAEKDPFGLVAVLVEALSARSILMAKRLGGVAGLEPVDETNLESFEEGLRGLPGGDAVPTWDSLGLVDPVDEAEAWKKLTTLEDALEEVDADLSSKLRARRVLVSAVRPRTSASGPRRAKRKGHGPFPEDVALDEAVRRAEEPGLPGLAASFVLLAAGRPGVRRALESRLFSRDGEGWPAAIPLYVATLDEESAEAFLARFLGSPDVGLTERYLVAGELERQWSGNATPAREAGLELLRVFAGSQDLAPERRIEAATRLARCGRPASLALLGADLESANLDEELRHTLNCALAAAGDEAALGRIRRTVHLRLESIPLEAFAGSGSLEDVPLLELARELHDLPAGKVGSAIAAIRARHGN